MLSMYIATINLMSSAGEKLRRRFADRSGVTAIEYGLIAGLIAVAIIAAVTTLGKNLSGLFNSVSGSLSNSGAL